MANYEDWSFEETVNFWKQQADADGWISKDPEEIADDIEDYDDRRQLEEILYKTMYYFNVEWENEDEKRWKFKEDDFNF